MKYLNQTGKLEYGVPAIDTGKKKASWRNNNRLFGINPVSFYF